MLNKLISKSQMFIEVNYLSEQFMSDSYRPNSKYSILERLLNNCPKLQKKKQVSPNQFIIDKKYAIWLL